MRLLTPLADVKSATDLPKGYWLIIRADDDVCEYPPRRLWQDDCGGWYLPFDRYGAGRMSLQRCLTAAANSGYDQVRTFDTAEDAFDWMYGVK